MKKNFKMILFLLLFLITVLFCAFFLMAQDRISYGTYSEITGDTEYEPATVMLFPWIIRYDSMGEKGFAIYRTEKSYLGDDVVELKIVKGTPPVESYLLHREIIDGRSVWILSDTLFEYDGRGLVIFNEYCKIPDRRYLPDDFESTLKHQLNDREATPTYVTD